MKILKDIQVKPFARVSWKGHETRKAWADSIAICSHEVQELEIKTVVAGLRKCAWRTIGENSLPEFVAQMSTLGLIVLPVQYVGAWEGFAHTTQQVKPGQPKMVYCIISADKDEAFKFRKAFEENDITKQGLSLGFPRCCSEWFEKQYNGGIPDPIWQAAQNTIKKNLNRNGGPDVWETDNKISLGTIWHPLSNPLLRYEGVRVSFHIPCSFNCEKTIILADKALNLINIIHRKAMNILLSMGMTWSALHGIGVVETPLFISNFNTIPTAGKFEVEIKGKYTPGEKSEKGS